jgi:hypothetical protein
LQLLVITSKRRGCNSLRSYFGAMTRQRWYLGSCSNLFARTLADRLTQQLIWTLNVWN